MINENSRKEYSVDILIIGAGPAGLCAGIEARKTCQKVLMLDDKSEPGGQLIKQTHMFFGSKKELAGMRGFDISRQLLNEYRALGGEIFTDTIALGIYPGGIVTAQQGDLFIKIHSQKIIVATGAYENMHCFPNCDLPGVYGAGGVQTLMNLDGVLPGKRILMVGAGNIGLIVSYQLLQAGAKVAAVVEARPDVRGYEVHAAKIRRMGVPILCSHSIQSAGGQGKVEWANLARVDQNYRELPGSAFSIDVDAICLSVGLSPLTELLSTARIALKYVPQLCGLVPIHDLNQRTSNPDIFVAGDVSGIEEASSAMVTGRIAGLTAAADLRGVSAAVETTKLRDQLAELRAGPVGENVRIGKARLMNLNFNHRNFKKTISLDSPAPEKTPTPPVFAELKTGLAIECYQKIPCNPCVESCHRDSIKIEGQMTDLPSCDSEDCDGCKLCLVNCPGLAMFYVDYEKEPGKAEVTIVYETVPAPQKGDTWEALDRNGKVIQLAEISAVRSAKSFDKKLLVSFLVDRENGPRARHIAPIAWTGELEKLPAKSAPDDAIICRCEDVYESTVRNAILAGHQSFADLKRVLRIGMGPCQGKTCSHLVRQILCQMTGKRPEQIVPQTTRTPIKPVRLEVLASAKILEDDYA